jgi:DNA-binding transcriptional LysR family regulator
VETRYLRTFLLVAESGSMSEAARRLEITPAAVAHQLKLLEQELGTRLMGRAGRTVALTEEGHRLVERAGAILRELGNLKASISDEAATRELKLGAINTALHSVMPEILAGTTPFSAASWMRPSACIRPLHCRRPCAGSSCARSRWW